MAKALLLRALRQSFGHVVDGLDPENLELALWRGEVNLENLSIRKDALNGIDLPIEIKVGKVKSLKLSCNWARLGSEPVRVVIDGIYVHAILKPEATSTPSTTAATVESIAARTDDFLQRRRLREKRRVLRWANLTEGEIDDDPRSSASQRTNEEDSGFMSQLLAKIVDNLIVEVRHCHIRIEDSSQWTNRSFAFGISLGSFSALTCDEKGRVQFVDRANETTLLHKMVKVEDVAIYLDPLDKSTGHGDDWWIEFLHASEFGLRRTHHKYILRPCSPHVLVTTNDAPSAESPRWRFEVELDGVHVGLSRVQFEDVTAVYLAAESHIVKMSPNPRPMISASRNPRAWWRYAIRSVIRDIKIKSQTRGWLALCNRVVKRQRYVALYRRTKKAPWLEPLSDREKEMLKELEDQLDVNDVLAFRATALAELRAQRAKSNPASSSQPMGQAQPSRSRGYVQSWFWSDSPQAAVELTPEEKAEVEAAIDYLEASRVTRVPDTTRNIVIQSSLKHATLTLSNATDHEIMLVTVEGQLMVETCVGPYWKTTFHLVSFEVVDRFTKDSIFPVLISPKKSMTTHAGAVMTVVVEVKPVDRPEDIAVSVSVIPFKIILVPSFVGQVSKFFAVSEETRLGEIATEVFAEWSESKQDDFVEALARRTLISLVVNIEDPVIACPLTVSRSAVDLHMIVLDLGRLHVESDDSRLKMRREESKQMDDLDPENLAVDAWKLRSTNVRAFLLPASEVMRSPDDWVFLNSSENNRVLFHDFDLDARLAVCITPKLLKVAKTRLSVSASALRLQAPPSLFRFASKLGTSWSKILAGAGTAVPVSTTAPTVEVGNGLLPSPPLLEVDINVDALIATLSLESDAMPLARVELDKFAMKHVRLSNGDVDSQMSLESVEVLDLYSKTPPILATSHADHVFHTGKPRKEEEEGEKSGRLIMVKTQYRRTGINVDARFNQLHINWNPETILAYKNAYHTPQHPDFLVDAMLEASALPPSPSSVMVVEQPPPTEARTFKVSASLNSLSMDMCKGDQGRVLARSIMSNARMEAVQGGAVSFKFWLGDFLSLQPNATKTALQESESYEFFTAMPGEHDSLFAFEYIKGGDFESKQSADESFVGITISPARLVHQQQMMLELMDYMQQGVMGAIVTKATDTLTSRTTEKYRIQLNWLQPTLIVPAQAALQTHPDSFFEFRCERVQASNRFESSNEGGSVSLVARAVFQANKLEVAGYLPSPSEHGGSIRTSLVKDPVDMELNISSPLGIAPSWTVKGNVSAIEICIPRVHYFLYHRMMGENILADPPKPGQRNDAQQGLPAPPVPPLVDDSNTILVTQKVTYAYDRNDAPPSIFNVSIFFPTASLQIVEDVGSEIATFAMRRATLRLVRAKSSDPTEMSLQVEAMDLVDDRPESRPRSFRHLILCDPSKALEDSQPYSFEVRFVSALALVEIDLHMFRSVVLLDLFSTVLNFITTTEPEEGAHDSKYALLTKQVIAPEAFESHPLEHSRPRNPSVVTTDAPEEITPWKGTFRLRRASMFFVCDWADPKTEAVALGGDLDLEWRKREDGCASTWTGKISRFELHRTTFPQAVPNATTELSAVALHAEVVGHQITEPAEVSFEYVYEMDSLHSKVHSRRIHFTMSQLENFLSISDIQTIAGVYQNMIRGDAPTAPPSLSASMELDSKEKPRQKQVNVRLPTYEYFQLGLSGFCWIGNRMDRPPMEIKPRLGDLPLRNAARVARTRLETKLFTMEFNRVDPHGLEFLEHDGFVTVGSVDKDSIAYGLIVPGDVLVSVNFTPVLTKTASAVYSIIEEDRVELNLQLPLTFTIHPADCRDPLVLKDSSHVESAAVLLHLIDDTGKRDLPLAHLSFSKINAFRNDNSAGSSVVSGANLLLAMHYHDPISGRWEMLMSPWTANLGVHFLPRGQIDAKFDTSNDLEFRLSDVFVRASADAVRRVTKSTPSPNEVTMGDDAQGACHLRNRTGMPLWFWLVQGEPANHPEKEGRVRVDNNEIVPFSFAHEKGEGAGTRRNYHRPRANRVQILLGDEGQYLPLPEIPAEIVHRGSVMLTPAGEGQSPGPAWSQMKVAWEVMLEDGRLCLELRSFRRVENLLKVPIQVLASGSLGGHSPDRIIIAPNSVAALPVTHGDISNIRIRPLNPNDYQWSEPSYVELAAQRGTSLVTCAPPLTNPDKLRPFLAHIHVQVEEEDGATVRFTVHPPIHVSNQLPVPLYCRVFSGRAQVGEDVVLPPGSSAQINQLSVEGYNSFIAFRLKNARQFTSDIRVERKKKVSSLPAEFRGDGSAGSVTSFKRMEETTQLTVIDGDGAVVPLSVVHQTTEYEGLRFVVYCPVWLVNRTELPLSYGYGQGKWISTGAGTSCPAGVMLYSSADDSGGKLQVRVAESTPSAPFSVSAPDGKARRLVVPGGPAWPFSFDLAVSVDVGSGDLYRTNVVTFAPRYLFLNRLPDVHVAVRQIWDDMSGVVGAAPPSELSIRSNAREPFWASSSTRVRPFKLEIRAFSPSGDMDTVWSSAFTLEKYLEGRAVVPVELQIKNQPDKLFRFNMEVREDQIAGSLDVDLYEWQAQESSALGMEQDEAGEEDYITVDLKKKILPKTVVKLRFPRVDVVLRRDAAAKHKIRPAGPPPPPAGSPGPRRSLSPPRRPLFPTSSSTSRPPPPPPAPPESFGRAGDSDSRGASPMSSVRDGGSVAPFGAVQQLTDRRGGTGESKEIARLTINSLDLTVGKRADGFRELQLFIKELKVLDPFPGATFREAIEGLSHSDGWLVKLHVIQRDLVFEKFLLRLPGLKLKVDERFVLGLARYANDAVIGPLQGQQVTSHEEDNANLVAEMIGRADASPAATPTNGTTPNWQNSLIFFNSFYISALELRLWYHQVKRDASTPSVMSMGIFSKMDIRIENHPVTFPPLSLKKPFGSYNLYAGMVRDHYEREARAQISGILMRSIDLTSASFAVADSLLSKVFGTEVRSKEFRGETLTNEEIVERYRRKIQKPPSLEAFVRDVVRNCAFDWSHNHTGLINSRRALVVGVVNRSDHDVEIRTTLERGQNFHIMPGGLAARQLGKDGIKVIAPANRQWDTSSTCLFLAYGFFDSVDLKLESNAFVARFVYVDTILQSRPGFSAAFLAKDVSKWLCWYVLMIENRLTS